jgi:hypothetical protein
MYTYVIELTRSKNFVTLPSNKPLVPKYYIGTKAAPLNNIRNEFVHLFRNVFFSEYHTIRLIHWSDDSFDVILKKFQEKIDKDNLRWDNYDSNFPVHTNLNKIWPKELEDQVRMDRYTMNLAELSAKYGRSQNSIKARLTKIAPEFNRRVVKKTKNAMKRWTTDEKTNLLNSYKKKKSISSLADEFGRSESAILQRLFIIMSSEGYQNWSINKCRKWTDNEISNILSLYGKQVPIQEIATQNNCKDVDIILPICHQYGSKKYRKEMGNIITNEKDEDEKDEEDEDEEDKDEDEDEEDEDKSENEEDEEDKFEDFENEDEEDDE